MSNSFFQFKQFIVHQDRCAMKVGTDGTLLGAWVSCPPMPINILDVGTGTGLVALMMAQRFPQAKVLGIEIDEMAVGQAMDNVKASPFAGRVRIEQADFCSYSPDRTFDVIVSNPPFYDQSLVCPDAQRTKARHTATLSYLQLMRNAWKLLADEGEISVIVPTDYRQRMIEAACLSGFSLVRQCAIKTTPRKNPRRYLLAFAKHPVKELETTELIIGSEEYQLLVDEFYLGK